MVIHSAVEWPHRSALKGGICLKKDKPKYRQIIDAAVIVIAENGYHQAQVSKIAKQAGVADGTIYLYFKNKEDILISVFQEKMGKLVDNIESKIAGLSSANEKLLIMVKAHFEMLNNDRHLARVTQLEIRQSSTELRDKLIEVLKRYLRVLDQILKEGIENGEFSEHLDVRLARQMIFGTIDEMITTWVINEGKYDLTALAPKVQKMLLNGLRETLA
jgi:TetR/AcrR family fatty acid metabolism transcriptional regulator